MSFPIGVRVKGMWSGRHGVITGVSFVRPIGRWVVVVRYDPFIDGEAPTEEAELAEELYAVIDGFVLTRLVAIPEWREFEAPIAGPRRLNDHERAALEAELVSSGRLMVLPDGCDIVQLPATPEPSGWPQTDFREVRRLRATLGEDGPEFIDVPPATLPIAPTRTINAVWVERVYTDDEIAAIKAGRDDADPSITLPAAD